MITSNYGLFAVNEKLFYSSCCVIIKCYVFLCFTLKSSVTTSLIINVSLEIMQVFQN